MVQVLVLPPITIYFSGLVLYRLDKQGLVLPPITVYFSGLVLCRLDDASYTGTAAYYYLFKWIDISPPQQINNCYFNYLFILVVWYCAALMVQVLVLPPITIYILVDWYCAALMVRVLALPPTTISLESLHKSRKYIICFSKSIILYKYL